VPGQVLALVETAARDAANRIGQALIQHALQVPAGRPTGPVSCGGYKGSLGAKTLKALDYFTSNAHRMQYHHYRANGWFIGSGPVEAACKTIVAQRAKQAGMRWTITGLNPVLQLRTLTRSGRDQLIWGNDPPQTTPTAAA
jgi:hypothetical protein